MPVKHHLLITQTEHHIHSYCIYTFVCLYQTPPTISQVMSCLQNTLHITHHYLYTVLLARVVYGELEAQSSWERVCLVYHLFQWYNNHAG